MTLKRARRYHVQARPSAKRLDYGRRNLPIPSTNIGRTPGRLEWMRGSRPLDTVLQRTVSKGSARL